MSQALCFKDVHFDVVPQNSQPWVRGYQIGTALGYGENADVSIRKLFTRHADEFTPAMTAVVKLPSEGGEQETRIFSLRGCHLLAMFARTPIAKEFRKWVLDVLDKLAESERAHDCGKVKNEDARFSKRSDPERKSLTSIINTWVGLAPLHYAAARAQVNAHFGVSDVNQLTVAQVKEAISFVQAKIDALPPVKHTLELPPPSDKCLEALARIEDLKREAHYGFGVVRDIVRVKMHPGAIYMGMSLDERALWAILDRFHQAADESLADAYNAIDASYRLGRLFARA